METLIAFGINWKLLLIQAVNFAIVLAILYRFLYRPIFAIIDKRQKVIQKGLEDAQAAARSREATANEREEMLASAREEGGKIVEGLRQHAVSEEKELLRAAQDKSGAILEEARTRSREEHDHLLRQSEEEIAKMAVLAAEKILRASHNKS